MINKAAVDFFGFSVSSGRMFTEDELEKPMKSESIIEPIILGSNLAKKSKSKVGDIKEINGRKYDIIGILSKNTYYPVHFDKILEKEDGEKYICLDDYAIRSPAKIRGERLWHSMLFDYTYLLFSPEKSEQEIVQILQKLTEDFHNKAGADVVFRSMEPSINYEMREYKEQTNVISIALFAMILFMSISVVISIMSKILDRKYEFGVHIFCGGTDKTVAYYILSELLIFMCLSLLLAFSVILITEKNIQYRYLTNMLIGFSAIIAITLFLGIMIIKKFNLNQLLKGDE